MPSEMHENLDTLICHAALNVPRSSLALRLRHICFVEGARTCSLRTKYHEIYATHGRAGAAPMRQEKLFCHFCGVPLGKRESDERMKLYCEKERHFIYENPIPAATGIVSDDSGRILLVHGNGKTIIAMLLNAVEYKGLRKKPRLCAARALRRFRWLSASASG
jgi:hypothetical protein